MGAALPVVAFFHQSLLKAVIQYGDGLDQRLPAPLRRGVPVYRCGGGYSLASQPPVQQQGRQGHAQDYGNRGKPQVNPRYPLPDDDSQPGLGQLGELENNTLPTGNVPTFPYQVGSPFNVNAGPGLQRADLDLGQGYRGQHLVQVGPLNQPLAEVDGVALVGEFVGVGNLLLPGRHRER